MNRITLKDRHYRVMGYIDTRSDGTRVGLDRHYRIVGYYKPRQDVTEDRHYRIVAHGDVLSGLIQDANT